MKSVSFLNEGHRSDVLHPNRGSYRKCNDRIIQRFNRGVKYSISGTHCDLNIDDCSSRPCQNGAICRDFVNYYMCTCRGGYTGVACEINIDECVSSPCTRGGTCVDDVNSYICLCLSGFTGTQCDIDVNECLSSPCHNDGTCVDRVAGYHCLCPPGLTGRSTLKYTCIHR